MKEIKTVKIHYPWLSVLLVLLAAIFYLLLANPELLSFYNIALFNISYSIQLLILVIVCGFVIWDIKRFNAQHKHYEETISELFKAKRQLQNKVNAYSGHSDKLKLFISERLLEYIQYDEKFLHFKNIAAEIRHNGVICFDKVQSTLTDLIELNESQNKYLELTANSTEALESMRYLWDLLDLSTTDNIALHIGNHLCECEEYYFQSLLQKNDNLPYEPTFTAHNVILNCLVNAVENPDALIFTDKNTNSPFVYNDALFYVHLDTNIAMLGNPNHMRLLAENLINNAQYYLAKKSRAKTQIPIAVELSHNDDNMQLTVYNHGQHIKEENKEKIFQLGYSTRRKKENHGKGLGLYFANSIAQGYEGNISFENVNNIADVYSIRIALDTGDIITEIVEVSVVNSLPVIIVQETEETQKNIEWKFSSLMTSADVFSKRRDKTYTFDINDQAIITLADPGNAAIPRWSLSISQKKHSSHFSFTPLDISGVKFQVSLPTAKARLDYSEETVDFAEDEPELDEYDNIISLEKHFKE